MYETAEDPRVRSQDYYAKANSQVLDALPLSQRLQQNLAATSRLLSLASDLRGRLFGCPPPSVVEGKSAEPYTAEEVANATQSALARVESTLSEITNRF